MHEAVSGQRSRRPSLTPSARVARGLATNAAAAAAPTPRRRTTARGFAGDAAAVRGVVLRSDAHRLKTFVNCSAIQRCVYLRILTRLLRNLVDRASILLLTWQAAFSCSQLLYSAALLDAGRDHVNAKIKQEMLLHKIGAFWDGPGWTKHRRAVRRAVTVRLCRASFRHAVGRRHKL